MFFVAIRPSYGIESGKTYTAGSYGALLVTGIQQAAMTRADVPEIDGRDFSLYVDFGNAVRLADARAVSA